MRSEHIVNKQYSRRRAEVTPRTTLSRRRAITRLVVAFLYLVAAATWTAFHPVTVNAFSSCVHDCEYYCGDVGRSCGGIWHWFSFENGGEEERCEWWCGA